MRNKGVNTITYGAVICAMAGAVMFFNRQLGGMFNAYMMWILPIPIIVYSVKFGVRNSAIMCIALLLLSLITADPTSIIYTGSAIVAGLVYGWGMNREKSAAFLIVSVFLISAIVTICVSYVFARFFGMPTTAELVIEVRETIPEIASFFQLTEEDVELMNSLVSERMLLEFYIILDLINSALEGVLVHLIAFIVLKRLKMKTPPIVPISRIYAPSWMKLFVFTAYLARILTGLNSITQYDSIIVPLYSVASMITFCFGYIFILTIINTIAKGNRMKSMLYLLIVLILGFGIMSYIGIYDIFSNIRKKTFDEMERRKNEKENGQS